MWSTTTIAIIKVGDTIHRNVFFKHLFANVLSLWVCQTVCVELSGQSVGVGSFFASRGIKLRSSGLVASPFSHRVTSLALPLASPPPLAALELKL